MKNLCHPPYYEKSLVFITLLSALFSCSPYPVKYSNAIFKFIKKKNDIKYINYFINI